MSKREGEAINGENPSKKAMTAGAKPMERVLIFGGKTGWIGQLMGDLVKKEGKEYSVNGRMKKRSQNLNSNLR